MLVVGKSCIQKHFKRTVRIRLLCTAAHLEEVEPSASADPPVSTQDDLYRFSRVVPFDRKLPKEYLSRLNNHLKEQRYRRKKPQEANPQLWYIAARAPIEYSIIDRVLRETHKFLPGWTPHSVFDVGAKINNVLWSAKAIWGEEIKEYTCVEDRQEMVASSKELSSGMGVNFARQLQLTSDPDAKKRTVIREPFVSADLTVCAFHLGNIGAKKKNLYLRELWKRTDNILVLIDSEFDVIVDAREFLLREYPDCKRIFFPLLPSSSLCSSSLCSSSLLFFLCSSSLFFSSL